MFIYALRIGSVEAQWIALLENMDLPMANTIFTEIIMPTYLYIILCFIQCKRRLQDLNFCRWNTGTGLANSMDFESAGRFWFFAIQELTQSEVLRRVTFS